MNKEEVYDAEIFPLMSKIIEICKANKIAMLADFAIGHEADEGLKYTTCVLDNSVNPPPSMIQALNILKPRRAAPMMITTTKPDGSKTITAVVG